MRFAAIVSLRGVAPLGVALLAAALGAGEGPPLAKLAGKPAERFQAMCDLWLVDDAGLAPLRAALTEASDAQAAALAAVLAHRADTASFDAILARARRAQDAVARRALLAALVSLAASASLAAVDGTPAMRGRLHDLALSSEGPAQRTLVDLLLAGMPDAAAYAAATGRPQAPITALIADRARSADGEAVAWALGRRAALTPAVLGAALDRALDADDAGARAVLEHVVARLAAGEAMDAIAGRGKDAEARLRALVERRLADADRGRALWALRQATALRIAVGAARLRELGPRADAATRGDWSGVYGRVGSEIPGDGRRLPAGLTLEIAGARVHTWATSSDDARAPRRGAAPGRIAACWHADREIRLRIAGTGASQVSIYLLDWDRLRRTAAIEALGDGDRPLAAPLAIDAYGEGVWVSVPLLNSATTLVVRGTGAQNVTVAAVCFD